MTERIDHSRLEAMTTASLKEYLRRDFTEESADVEDILYIADLLVRREEEAPTGLFAGEPDARKKIIKLWEKP